MGVFFQSNTHTVITSRCLDTQVQLILVHDLLIRAIPGHHLAKDTQVEHHHQDKDTQVEHHHLVKDIIALVPPRPGLPRCTTSKASGISRTGIWRCTSSFSGIRRCTTSTAGIWWSSTTTTRRRVWWRTPS